MVPVVVLVPGVPASHQARANPACPGSPDVPASRVLRASLEGPEEGAAGRGKSSEAPPAGAQLGANLAFEDLSLARLLLGVLGVLARGRRRVGRTALSRGASRSPSRPKPRTALDGIAGLHLQPGVALRLMIPKRLRGKRVRQRRHGTSSSSSLGQLSIWAGAFTRASRG